MAANLKLCIGQTASMSSTLKCCDHPISPASHQINSYANLRIVNGFEMFTGQVSIEVGLQHSFTSPVQKRKEMFRLRRVLAQGFQIKSKGGRKGIRPFHRKDFLLFFPTTANAKTTASPHRSFARPSSPRPEARPRDLSNEAARRLAALGLEGEPRSVG